MLLLNLPLKTPAGSGSMTCLSPMPHMTATAALESQITQCLTYKRGDLCCVLCGAKSDMVAGVMVLGMRQGS